MASARAQLSAAQGFLARAAKTAVGALAQGDEAAWGRRAKRTHADLPVHDRPALVGRALRTQNLAELIDMCATVERLIDALAWAETALPGWHVRACHPTTSGSSRQVESPDNDLVLEGPRGEEARFEVSDIVGSAGTAKAKKDVENLRTGSTLSHPSKRRCFLVVSPEMANDLLREKRTKVPAPIRFERRSADVDGTAVIEVVNVELAGPPT